MDDTTYQKIHPSAVYNGINNGELSKEARLHNVLQENRPTGNNFIDLFATLIRMYGNLQAKQYAEMMGVEARLLMASIVAMTGMGAREWICEYLRLASCELLEKTDWPISLIAKKLGFTSVSAFSQFFQRQENIQPYGWRSRQRGKRRRSYHFTK